MAKEIAIIIPVYKAHLTIRRALSSLDFQDIKNQCEVVLINDCDGSSYHYLIKEYPELKITILKTSSNGGPAIARNKGLEYVLKHDFKYLMFLDADDAFYSHHSVAALYSQISTNDLVYSRFLIEHENGSCEWREDYDIWLFGKMYKTEIIKYHNIHFPPISRNEDVAFNMWYWICANKCSGLPDITYIWKYNSNSITRNNNREYVNLSNAGLCDNLIYVLQHLNEDLYSEAAHHILIKFIKFYWQYCENPSEDFLISLKILFKSAKKYWDYITEDIIKEEYLNISSTVSIFPTISFKEFLLLLQ